MVDQGCCGGGGGGGGRGSNLGYVSAIMVTEGEARGHHRQQLEGPKIVELRGYAISEFVDITFFSPFQVIF